MLLIPLVLYGTALLTLIAVLRRVRWQEASHSWRVAGLLLLAMFAFGIGTCSFAVGWSPGFLVTPEEAARWPLCLLLATVAAIGFNVSAHLGGRLQRTAPGKPHYIVAVSCGIATLAAGIAAVVLVTAH
jgi:hypothetical protein